MGPLFERAPQPAVASCCSWSTGLCVRRLAFGIVAAALGLCVMRGVGSGLAMGQEKPGRPQIDETRWPMVLTDEQYKSQRDTIKAAFASLTANNGVLAFDEQATAREAFGELIVALKENIGRYDAADYGEARSYLELLQRRFDQESQGKDWRKPRPKPPTVSLAQQVRGGQAVEERMPNTEGDPAEPTMQKKPSQDAALQPQSQTGIPEQRQWRMRDGSIIDGRAFEYALRGCRVSCTVRQGTRRGRVFVDGERIHGPEGSALFARLAQMLDHEASELGGFEKFFSQSCDFSIPYWVLRCDSHGREIDLPIPLLADAEIELLRPSFQHWREEQIRLAADNEVREAIKRAAWAQARKTEAVEELSRALDRNSEQLQRLREASQ